MTTGITVALAWNLPDKPTYPEPEHNHRIGSSGPLVNQVIENGTVNDDLGAVIKKKQNTANAKKNHIANQIASYLGNYSRNRRPDSYYFGHKNSNGYSKYYYYASDNSTENSTNPPHDFNSLLETLHNRMESLKISSKST